MPFKKRWQHTNSKIGPNGTERLNGPVLGSIEKIIKPGTMKTVHLPLLETDLGDSWPIPVTILHGIRPGPVITILGGVHGDELTGPLYLYPPIIEYVHR